jgi:hypothetical protein
LLAEHDMGPHMGSGCQRLQCALVVVWLVLAVTPYTRSAVDLSHVTSASQLTDALRDSSITNIVLSADVDMSLEVPRWRQLGNVVIRRNVTISGTPANSYALIDWQFWPQGTTGAW